MSEVLPEKLHKTDAEKLYWNAWDIYNSSRFEAPAYARRREKAALMLWKSYCNGCNKAAGLLNTILTKYPELKNTWSENLFQ